MSNREESLNPFGTGQCLTTQREKALIYSLSQSLWNRAVSYDLELSDKQRKGQLSQSLWNRAVSYDEITRTNGSASRKSQSLWNRAVSYDERRLDDDYQAVKVSIPLEQGSVLRQTSQAIAKSLMSLNPFGTGQCLTTKSLALMDELAKSQSLWNRAVSYDCSGVIKPCATRLTEATSQLFPRLRELGLDLAKF